MRVFVTGATGFVGSHIVRALKDRGHEVRVLARSIKRVDPALKHFGLSDIDAVIGDITDRDTIKKALSGCDAVIHAASVYSFDSSKHQEMRHVNITGTRLVLEEAVAQALDPIVHVSSYVALLPADNKIAQQDALLGVPQGVYAQTKAASEHFARSLQASGAPIVITWPGAVIGPYDPYDGETNNVLFTLARNRYPAWCTGGYPVVDVRDLADAHAVLLQKGLGPRRYMMTGHYVDSLNLVRTIEHVSGLQIDPIMFPASLIFRIAQATESIQSMLPENLRLAPDGSWNMNCRFHGDISQTVKDLDVKFRPFIDSVRDTFEWAIKEQRIPPFESLR